MTSGPGIKPGHKLAGGECFHHCATVASLWEVSNTIFDNQIGSEIHEMILLTLSLMC